MMRISSIEVVEARIHPALLAFDALYSLSIQQRLIIHKLSRILVAAMVEGDGGTLSVAN
jgi:hypothetical protein